MQPGEGRGFPVRIASLLFVSGLAALVYQTAWQKMFGLVFGASTGASAAVLAVFMAGLGIGGLVLGRRAQRSPRPLALYGHLEILVALTAAITPLTLAAGRWLYLATGGSATLGDVGATLMRLLLTTVAVGPCVFLMGGTLPAAARAAETRADQARQHLAALYALNTLGAVAGSLVGTLVVFEMFGTRLTLWVAVLLNLLVGVVARRLGLAGDPVPTDDEATRETDVAVEAAPSPDASTGHRLVLLGLAFGAGLAFLGLELVWYRLLGPILGGTTYTFGLVLATALTGIGGGAWLYARRRSESPPTLSGLAFVTALEAFAVAAPLLFAPQSAVLAHLLRGLAVFGFGVTALGWLLVLALHVLPAALVSGYQLPMIFALVGRGRRGVAVDVAHVYAANTVGSITGSLLVGFIVLPALGAVGTWRLVTWVLAAMAVGAWASSTIRRPARPGAGAALTAVVLAASVGASLAAGPGPEWRHGGIGAGRAPLQLRSTRQDYAEWRNKTAREIAWDGDGVEASVALQRGGTVGLIVNGKNDSSIEADKGTILWSSLLPALLHAAPKRVHIVGLGTGVTAGVVAQVPGVERVTVSELEPLVVRVADDLKAVNFDVTRQPKVRIDIGDAREQLLVGSERFDVISSEPSNPYRAGVATLFTREFYHAVKGRLSDHGIFAQWLQSYEVDTWTLQVAVATFRSAFEHVQIWVTLPGDMILVGSRAPIVVDAAAMKQRLKQAPFARALLTGWHTDRLEGVLAHYVGGEKTVAAIAGGSAVNTDDQNYLEYSFARSVGLPLDNVDYFMRLARRLGDDRPPIRGPYDDGAFQLLRARVWRAEDDGWLGAPASLRLQAREAEAICRGQTTVARGWSSTESNAVDALELYATGLHLVMVGNPMVVPVAEELGRRGLPVARTYLLARHNFAAGSLDEAQRLAIDAYLETGTVGLGFCAVDVAVMRLLRGLGKKSPARAGVIARVLLDHAPAAGNRERARRRFALMLVRRSGDRTLCDRALAPYRQHPRLDDEFKAIVRWCTGKPRSGDGPGPRQPMPR